MTKRHEKKKYLKPRIWKGKLKLVEPAKAYTEKKGKKVEISPIKVYRLPARMKKEGKKLYLKTGSESPYLIDRNVASMLKKLLKAGVNVERPVKAGNMWIITKELGTLLHRKLNKMSTRQKSLMLTQLAKQVGKMHAQGISHEHPHEKNMIIDEKNKAGLIDFKFALTHNIN